MFRPSLKTAASEAGSKSRYVSSDLQLTKFLASMCAQVVLCHAQALRRYWLGLAGKR